MGFNCLKARATSRRQFTFYHIRVPVGGYFCRAKPGKARKQISGTAIVSNMQYKMLNIICSIMTVRLTQKMILLNKGKHCQGFHIYRKTIPLDEHKWIFFFLLA